LFVRGFTVLEAQCSVVKSSDHNPILVTLAAQPAEEKRGARSRKAAARSSTAPGFSSRACGADTAPIVAVAGKY
jgi:hypothetical protein